MIFLRRTTSKQTGEVSPRIRYGYVVPTVPTVRGLWGKGPPALPSAQERPLLNAPVLRDIAKPLKQKGAPKACWEVHLDAAWFFVCLFVFYHFLTWSLRNPNTSQQVNETQVSSCFWKRPGKTICFTLLCRTSESLNLFVKKNPNQECMPPCNLKQLCLKASILRQNALVLLEFLARTVLPETASESHSLLSASCKIW